MQRAPKSAAARGLAVPKRSKGAETLPLTSLVAGTRIRSVTQLQAACRTLHSSTSYRPTYGAVHLHFCSYSFRNFSGTRMHALALHLWSLPPCGLRATAAQQWRPGAAFRALAVAAAPEVRTLMAGAGTGIACASAAGAGLPPEPANRQAHQSTGDLLQLPTLISYACCPRARASACITHAH